ncbi:binding-protein-dependent transport systems inner membrane component [Beutenbergia cavernae DSM 12333]|uniref:Binding-protein-dependent transport systems inner membrane component n=1 Tax=Beutenbergia cavernae (strain ATCC BAA-8 / DSM 12333 / CCUG 43141 / JCM 11478 / NBRC 16432 / NCIMB 13614 / HKI 0122) TaxID=471853 RepID=C5BX10_BEUC1|nr:methionine ABC transporter permease [Beutenbergia cavernae]ACQ78685.1 binding-protein-dependent transport systems inner membrane component [Beutenbergia cavernae DSM 12333]
MTFAGIDLDVVVPKVADALYETLLMVTASFVLATVIGLVLGIFLFATRSGQLLQSSVAHTVLNIVVNTLRPIPFIILLIALTPVTRSLIGTSIGPAAAILPLTIAASVGIARVAESNLVAVDPGVVEAAKAIGARPLHILFGFVVREAFGPLLLSLTFIFVALIDATAVAGAVGGGGLGNLALTYGYQRFDYGVMILIIVVLIGLVQLVQLLGNRVARRFID